MNELNDSVIKLKKELATGASFEEALRSLHKQNISPVQTIYAIHKVKRVN